MNFAKELVRQRDAMERDRIDEGSLERIEKTLLGTVIMHTQTLKEATTIKPDDFNDERAGIVWGAVVRMSAAGKDHSNPMLIADELRDSGELELIGGQLFINETFDHVANSSGVEGYVKIIKREALRRKSKSSAVEFMRDIDSGCPQEAVECLLSNLEGEKGTMTAKTGMTMLEVVKRAMDRTLEGTAIETGYFSLDQLLGGGVSQSAFTIIAAGPSYGKSALSVNLAMKATKDGKPVRCLYICMEMDEVDLFDRMMGPTADMKMNNAKRLRRGDDKGIEHEWEAYGQGCSTISEMGHIIEAGGLIDVYDLRSLVAMHADHIDMVVVDYIQQIKPSYQGQKKMETVNEASWTCKDLCLKYKIPIFALAQLNREGYKEGKKPELANLRESGQLEQDADNVWMLWRDKEKAGEELEVFVGKNRNGPVARVGLQFDLAKGNIRNLEPKPYN